MKKFTAYRIDNQNDKVTAQFVEMAIDDLDPGEVVLKTEYSSVNYKDALAATGAGKIIRRFPCNGGIDVAGSVFKSADSRFREGDQVIVTGYDLGVAHDGGYAEYVRVPASWVVAMPKGMTALDAMAIGTAGFTAALAIEQMEVNGLDPANGPVAVTGATGGVGSIAIDLLAGLGYAVTAITGKDSEHDFLRKLGAAEVISRHTLEMGKRPLEKSLWAGAVDSIGGEPLAWLTRTMQQNGSIASCGLTAGIELNTTVMPFILRGVNLLGIDSVNCAMALRQRIWQRLASDMKPNHQADITEIIPFVQLPGIFPRFLNARSKGRVVVKIG